MIHEQCHTSHEPLKAVNAVRLEAEALPGAALLNFNQRMRCVPMYRLAARLWGRHNMPWAEALATAEETFAVET